MAEPKKIAHRGNFDGKNPDKENTLKYIERAFDAGYDVEADIWKMGSFWFLGHDAPAQQLKQLEVSKFFNDQRFWWHAKNIEALESLMGWAGCKVFAHESDRYGLVTNDYVWTADLKAEGNRVILMVQNVMDVPEAILKNVYGICADDFRLAQNWPKI